MFPHVVQVLKRLLRFRSMGLPAGDGRLINHLIWADVACWLAQTSEHLAAMPAGFLEAMQGQVGMLLGPGRCTGTSFGPESHRPPTEDLPPVLRSMERARGRTCLRVQGDLGYSTEAHETKGCMATVLLPKRALGAAGSRILGVVHAIHGWRYSLLHRGAQGAGHGQDELPSARAVAGVLVGRCPLVTWNTFNRISAFQDEMPH